MAGVVIGTRESQALWVLHDSLKLANARHCSITRIWVGKGYLFLQDMGSFLTSLKMIWTPQGWPFES